MFSQKGGRTPAEIRRRKNNRPSCFIRRTEKQTQRRNGRTPAEIVAKRKTSVGFFCRSAEYSQRRNGRMPAEIRLKKNARPSFFFRCHLKLPQRRNGRMPAEIRLKKNARPSCFFCRRPKQPWRKAITQPGARGKGQGHIGLYVKGQGGGRTASFIVAAGKRQQKIYCSTARLSQRDGRMPASRRRAELAKQDSREKAVAAERRGKPARLMSFAHVSRVRLPRL